MKKTVTDQMLREVTFSFPPKRIVSIVPSQTELLHYLGLENEVIAITKFCIHPNSWFKTKLRIGGTKKLNLKLIESLNPDLIIGNKEENSKEDVEFLVQKFPIWMSDICTIQDSLSMISEVGKITDRVVEATKLVMDIEAMKEKFNASKNKIDGTFAYLIWYNPIMLAGQNTFINELCKELGLTNSIPNVRYPQMDISQLKEIKPNYIFLSSEPFPFKQKHILELEQVLPNSKIILVDGEMFSWYGSRLLHSFNYFSELISSLKN